MSSEYHAARAVSEALIKPVQDMLEKIAGPACEEVGLMLQDHVKVYRFKRQLRLLQKTQEILKESCLKVHSVPPKLLLPIMDYASVEGDDDLQDMWAALLANAASADSEAAVLPAFLEVLKQLSAYEVHFLNHAYDEVLNDEEQRREWESADTENATKRISLPIRQDRFEAMNQVSISNLARLGILDLTEPPLITVNGEPSHFTQQAYLTLFGRAFIAACRAPFQKP